MVWMISLWLGWEHFKGLQVQNAPPPPPQQPHDHFIVRRCWVSQLLICPDLVEHLDILAVLILCGIWTFLEFGPGETL